MTQPQQLIEEDPCPRLCSSPGCSGCVASTGRPTMSDFCGDCRHNATQPDSRSCIRADWTDGRCLGFERDHGTPDEDRPVAASGRLLASKPIAASNRAAVADRCSECLNRGIGSHGYCPRSDWSADRTRCSGWELDPDVRAPAPERCSLCTAVATVHLPPELGASALCRPCADRVRAALEPPAEAERKQMDALYNLGVRGSRVPRCTCPDCCR